MNVLQLISSGGLFGAENVVLELSSELKKRSVEPIVGALENSHNPHLELLEGCRKKKLETVVFPCRGKFDIDAISWIRKFIQERKIEIVHSHGYKSNILAYLSTIGTECAAVSSCHNWIEANRKLKLYGYLDRFFLRFFDRIIAVSSSVEKKLCDSGVAHHKITTIPNGVDIDRFSPAEPDDKLRKDLRIANDDVVVGTVGRLSREKGHVYFLKAAAKVLEKYPHTVFILVGEGPLGQELRRDFPSSKILFLGPRYDVERFYSLMDLFVLPSLTEGLPMALLEAMASAKPVIATTVGSVPSALGRETAQAIVPPGDEIALYKAMVYFFENRDIAKKVGVEYRNRVVKNFSAANMAEQYLSVYLQTMGKEI